MKKPVTNNPLLVNPGRALPRSLGVVGAGTIGPDIAYYLKSEIPHLKLVLVDVRQQALDGAVERLHGYATKGMQRGKLTEAQGAQVIANISTTLDYAALAECDWVIEAATENLELKKHIFAQVESIIRPDALITSNTSSIPASRLYSHLRHPERATVTHFFAPAYRNPAVEVIAWDKSDPAFIDYLRWLFCVTGKVPMLTTDVVCFMLDRIFDNWCNESGLLLERATPAEVDTVASDYATVGPFFVLNMSNGNPIIIETNTLQMEVEGAHYRPADVFKNAGRWDTVPLNQRVDVPADRAAIIRDRLLGILFSQSVDILDRAIGTPEDLDLGCRLAFALRKGPLELMRQLGESETQRILEKLGAERPGMPMPKRPIADYTRFRRFVLVDEVPAGPANDGMVRVITLRRPEALNAMHDEMTDEILSIIEEFEDDPATRGFILTGYGTKAFCAGADIGKFPALLGNHAAMVDYARHTSRLLLRMDRCRKPIVAALNGMALGGGLELAIRCQGIVATPNAWLQFPEISLGIVPGIGGVVVPYRRWPQAAEIFHGMLTRAERLPAERARAAGIIDTLVDGQAQLIPAAVALIRELQDRRQRELDTPIRVAPVRNNGPDSRDALGQPLSRQALDILCKAIEDAAAAPSFAAALEVGYQATGASACTEAAREGISAFGEKRKPDFARSG